MSDLDKKIVQHYGNQLRVRVCGICVEGNEILLVRHQALGKEGIFWSPPGGGMEYGQSAEENLIREFREETGLDIRVIRFLFVHEYLDPPLHAIELFYEVQISGGIMKLGRDPEMADEDQIIREVKFISFNAIRSSKKSYFHNTLSIGNTPAKLKAMHGYYIFTQ